jgi:hypothetical protein
MEMGEKIYQFIVSKYFAQALLDGDRATKRFKSSPKGHAFS